MNNEQTGLPDYVPARIVNEYIYCPRLAYLEWVQSEFAVNYEVADGKYLHRAVDRETGELPEELEEEEKIHARSIWLSSPEEKISARIDLVEGENECVTPVDYKRGEVPDNPEKSWPTDRVQLCAQGLVLRSNGYRCDGGVLYYSASRSRIPIRFDEKLIADTREAVTALFSMADAGAVPPPLIDSPKCEKCSLSGICLPDETVFLSGTAGAAHSKEIRRIMPARSDDIPLYIQEQGARLGQRGEVFEVHKGKTKIGEARIFEVSQVNLFGKVQVSAQVIHETCTRGIPLVFFSTGGWFYGMANGMPGKNIELRMAQYRTAEEKSACLLIASELIASKIDNSRTMLMRNHGALPDEAAGELKRLAAAAASAASLESLLGIEGMAARVYFSHFTGMLKPQRQGDTWAFDFQGRNRRPPLDPVNSLISYAYSLLAKDMTVTAMAVGFDPFLGLYHQPRYGRPSLALDLMEEFRPIVADSVVIWTINNGVLTADDFIKRGPAVTLKPGARKKFIEAYERRLDTLITHTLFGYRISYRRVFDVQTRLLARLLTGEIDRYPAFRTR